ncbi:MAG TPA: adenylate/guanylate cyclase domain-containing protein [Candidatus Cloacimonadota bacterium]|nr:adenylate/guanylate cyclase domain-containing protein [Candidatus Cloacimonadota bacterium]
MQLHGLYQGLKQHYKSFWLLGGLALIIAGGVHCVSLWPFLRELEAKSLDLRFRLDPHPQKASPDILLIAIDDGSLAFAREELGQGWPWPREFYAVVTDYLQRAGAAATIFDLSYEEADFQRGDIDSEVSDQNFASALQRSPHSVLPLTFTFYDGPTDSLGAVLPLEGLDALPVQNWPGLKLPYRDFAASAAGFGGINLLSTDEATVRKVPLLYRWNNRTYPNLALAGLLASNREHPLKQDISGYLQKLHPDPDGELHLNWYGKGGAEGTFRYIPFSQLLASAVQNSRGEAPTITPETFRDKYVIIGSAASGMLDLKASPYDWGLPGMEIWATALSNLLQEDYLRFPSGWIGFLLLFLLSFLVLTSVARLRAGFSPLVVLGLLLLFSLVTYQVFREQRLVLDYSSMLLVWVVSWIGILTLSYIMEGRTKQELKQIFDSYLHPDLVDELMKNPQLTELGGKSYHATVVFSDIYNFTTYSEKKEPPQLVNELNDYFRSFTNSILDHNGLLDKYTGDGLMAIFGVPVERNDHALWACRAALSHRDFCRPFRDKDNSELTASQYFHLNTRLGICTGKLVAGNIGSKRRMEYTGIGDTVNLASRLEGVNKIFRTNIIISESTYLMVKDQMLCRELDLIKVKGKSIPTRIYELLAERGASRMPDYSWLQIYADGLELYRKGLWAEAIEQFEQLEKDNPSRRMLLRCQRLLQEPPLKWDRIYPWEDEAWEEQGE